MKYKNLIFLILSIILITSVAIFNYKMDYYELDEKLSPFFDITRYESVDNYFVALKKYKDFKFEKVIIGGSTAISLFQNPITLRENKIALLSIPNLSLNEQKKLFKIFIDMHPECKTLIIPASYPNFYNEDLNLLKEYKDNKITAKEFFNLYLSTYITTKNIKKIINNINPTKDKKNKIKKNFVEIHPKITYRIKEINYDALNSLKEISQICREKNIKIICLIEPLHMFYISQLYKNNKFDEIKIIKNLLVNEFDSVIDFSITNEINKINFEKNYLFTDVVHPNILYGNIVYDIILDRNNNEIYKNLYIKLNKKNIKNHLIKYENDIIKYINDNNKEIEKYLNNTKLEYHEQASFIEIKDLENMPQILKKYLININFK